MGPGALETSSIKLVDALGLTTKTDKFKYRIDVRMWMQRVKVFANGGDTRAKGIANGYGHALYASMDTPYQKIIEAEIQLQKLTLGPVEDDQVLSYQEHKEKIEQILLVVAKESQAGAAKRFISTERKVFTRKRKKSETYTDFEERFRVIAQEHLNCLQHAPSDQEKQIIALVLLDNAELPDNTYNNLLSILINKVADPESPKSTNALVSCEELTAINSLLNKSADYAQHETRSETNQLLANIITRLDQAIGGAKDALVPPLPVLLRRIPTNRKQRISTSMTLSTR